MDQKTLKTLLRYDPDSGVFHWLPRMPEMFTDSHLWPRENRCSAWNKKYANTRAGSPGVRGYEYIQIGDKNYRSHRLVWLYMTGEWPAKQIDHSDRVSTNNRFSNLRIATPSENTFNRCDVPNRSVSRGVRRHCNRWHARIKKDGKTIFIGAFATEDEASAAYSDAAMRLFGAFSNGAAHQ